MARDAKAGHVGAVVGLRVNVGTLPYIMGRHGGFAPQQQVAAKLMPV